jgi:hypothetical protein
MDSKYNGDIHAALAAGAYDNKLPYEVKGKDETTWRAYQEESARLSEEFRTDALEYVGLTGHPKAGKAYGLAWSNGHSSGLADVLSHLFDLAELLKD